MPIKMDKVRAFKGSTAAKSADAYNKWRKTMENSINVTKNVAYPSSDDKGKVEHVLVVFYQVLFDLVKDTPQEEEED